MTDEAAILLRISLFGLAAAIVYWFVSYEPFGTVALLVLGLGPGFAALFAIRQHRRAGGPKDPFWDTVRRLAGLPRADPEGPAEYEADEVAVIPLPSIWPLGFSLGIAILTTGFIFGLWLIVLGLGVVAVSLGGWLAAINRENLYGRVLKDSDAGPHEPNR